MGEAEISRTESSRARATDDSAAGVRGHVVVPANPRSQLLRHELSECRVPDQVEEPASRKIVHHYHDKRRKTFRSDQVVPGVLAFPLFVEKVISVVEHQEIARV